MIKNQFSSATTTVASENNNLQVLPQSNQDY